MLFVLATLSWLFWLATMVLGFYGNGCPDIRGCCGSADADCGRPHRAYDGGSFYAVSRIVLSSWLRLFLAFSFSLFWAPMLVFSWVSYLRLCRYRHIGLGGSGFSVAVASFSLFFGLLYVKWTGRAPACNKIIKINKALGATSSGLWRRVLWFLSDSFAGWAGFAGLIGLLALWCRVFVGLLVKVSCW